MADHSPGVNILNLPPALAAEVIDGLVELVTNGISCGKGFEVEQDDTTKAWVLEDRASGDWWLEGHSYEALSAIAASIGKPEGENG